MVQCLEEHQIVAMANGSVPDAERDLLERHLDHCRDCLELVSYAARAAAATAVTAVESQLTGGRPISEPSQRYELGDEIARGGMGQIFDAYDHRLGRRVAVKCARDDHPVLEARFAREVRLTARLQHPSIIAIHDAGKLPDGRSFYAMPRIHGRPLDHRIAGATFDERLALLPHVIALVDAVAYVHEQGILHRDLKPHNVLVGEFGETVLVDWGLAKVLSEPSTPESEAGATHIPNGGSDDAASIDGTVLGTRGYMSPEQAGGLPVDQRADVYGLGATLLHLITGRAPAPRSAAAKAPWIPPQAPQDLLAIATRAMAADPADRYASAREMADDLHRFHAGRLVQAHRYTTGQLVRRWIVQHRTLVALAAAALAAVAIISVVAIRRVISARELAEAERARALSQRDAAQSLVGFALGDLRLQLEQVYRLDALESLAHKINDYYTQVNLWETRPVDLRQRAAALGVLGEVHRTRAEQPQAEALLTRGIELAREAVRRDDSPASDEELCRSLMRQGTVALDSGKPEGRAQLAECAAIARKNLARDPSNESPFRLILARTLNVLGRDAFRRDDHAASRTYLDEAQAIGRAVEDGGDPRGAREIAQAAAGTVMMLVDTGHWAEAVKNNEIQLEAALRLVGNRPRDMIAKASLVQAWQRAGEIRMRQRDLVGAEQAYLKGHRLISAMAEISPDNRVWTNNLAALEHSLGRIAQLRGDQETATTRFMATRDLWAGLVEKNPTGIVDRDNLGVAYIDLGDAQLARGLYDQARESYNHALLLWEQLRPRVPGTGVDRSRAIGLLHLGRLELAVKKPKAARQVLDESLALTQRILTSVDDGELRKNAVEVYIELSRAVPELSRKYVEEAVTALAPLRARAATDAELAELVATVERVRGKPAK